MLNFPASHSVWQFLETARPTLNLPVRTDGPTTFSTSATYIIIKEYSPVYFVGVTVYRGLFDEKLGYLTKVTAL